MNDSDPSARASTVLALRRMRELGVDTSAMRDKMERLERESELVARQLDGFERPVAPYLGIDALEWVEPATGHYRDRLLDEQSRLTAEIDFWSIAARHLAA